MGMILNSDHSWMRSRFAVGCVAVLAVVVIATLCAAVALWPRDAPASPTTTPAASGPLLAATVVGVRADGCRSVPAGTACRRVSVRLEEGSDAGRTTGFDVIGDFAIGLDDGVMVVRNALPPDAQVGGVEVDAYAFSDFARTRPLAVLLVLFCVMVVIAARLQGVRALLGVGLTLLVVVAFVVPAIARGDAPVAVALVGALLIVVISFPLVHGWGPKTLAAMLGTIAAVVLTLALGTAATRAAHITGFASEEAAYLSALAPDISIRGLLLAGLVIGALGVLDDIAVTQASTVMALRRVNPGLGPRQLFREAHRVGRDHIVSVVNTLILAYVGASLPVVMVFASRDVGVMSAINSEVVAAEVVATLVGSIGLIVAVPLTTAIAALLGSQIPSALVPEGDGHVHAHG